MFRLTLLTFGDEPKPATADGTFPATVELLLVLALLFVECPMKNAAANAAAPTTTAIRRMRTGLLMAEAGL